MNTNKSNKNIFPKKIKNKSRTLKSRIPSRNNAIKQIYNKDYYGKDFLPTTDIIEFINANFNDYMSMKEQKTAQDLPASSFEDFFIVDDNLKKKENTADIDIQINKQPNVSLNKLLAYSLYYSEYKNWFNSPKKNMDTALLKNQIGKDLSRIDITINNVKYESTNEDTNNMKTDNFNIELMNILSKFGVVDFDLTNKIGIAMCQNILNFMTDLITMLISKKIDPEKVLITKAEKNVLITLTKSQQNIVYNFKTKFYITKDGGIDDPEFTCGDMEIIFVIDLKKNTYKIQNFKCKYNADTCYQTENVVANKASNEANTENKDKKDNPNYFKYGIPIALGVGGIVAAPFLLAALGGKNKKLKTKRVNNKKSKKINRKNKQKNKKTKKQKKSFYN